MDENIKKTADIEQVKEIYNKSEKLKNWDFKFERIQLVAGITYILVISLIFAISQSYYPDLLLWICLGLLITPIPFISLLWKFRNWKINKIENEK